MPLYIYRGTDCGHEVEKFFHTFEDSKASIKCEVDGCQARLGRTITGDHRVWAPPMKKRLKKIFTKWNNSEYAYRQGLAPNRDKHYDLGKGRKRK